MVKSGWVVACAIIASIYGYPSGARADEAGDGGAAIAAMPQPQRERDLIAILTDARKRYLSSRSASAARDGRMGMQIRVIAFMRQGQAAQDWTGVVKTHGTTPEGAAWIVIEIADDITIATWQTESEDLNAGTLLKPHSPLFAVAQSVKIGQPVTFSGTILKSVLAADDEMVARPQFIARFSALKAAQ